MAKDIDPKKDFRYLRPGHVDLGRPCDLFAKKAVEMLPGTGTLPSRWSWVSKESFCRRYEPLGPVVWAKTASYHTLMINGTHIFRLWTDSAATSVVDVHGDLSLALSDTFEVIGIPASTRSKTKPFIHRVRVKNLKQVEIIMLQTLVTFGLV